MASCAKKAWLEVNLNAWVAIGGGGGGGVEWVWLVIK